jgi:hypothetical protein
MGWVFLVNCQMFLGELTKGYPKPIGKKACINLRIAKVLLTFSVDLSLHMSVEYGSV